ncbi:MAG TPA: ABC transporter ATP-binding protein [Paracoccaceae bacterium]|nr:ABC transporter ATP-binding protein [Paracoccaceae bacterium]
MTQPPLLQVRDLRVSFRTPQGELEAVSGVDLDIADGEVLGIVGESGSGKSVAMKAVMRLLPPRARISGSVRFRGQELTGASEREMRRLRGGRIAMIFQDPLTAFNPVVTIGEQIGEMLWLHDRSLSKAQLRARTVELLELVSIPEPHRRADAYPHEFSGGMRQRAMIAMAIANDPAVLIADEPTTALDVTVQAQILDVLRELQQRLGIGLALVTHDLGVVAGMAQRVAVMYSGRIVEQAAVDDLFAHPRHPYTLGLIGAVPRLDRREAGLVAIEGSPPSLAARPKGCPFAPRCPFRREICTTALPPLRQVGASMTACHFAEELTRPDASTTPSLKALP